MQPSLRDGKCQRQPHHPFSVSIPREYAQFLHIFAEPHIFLETAIVFVHILCTSFLYNEKNSNPEAGAESADIFETAMENVFRVGSVLVDAMRDGTL